MLGPRPDGSAWSIGIQHPRATERTIASIQLARGALATSGDYERFFELDGKRYCHILNPETGWPVQGWQSISVVAPLCVAAGAVSTIAMLQRTPPRHFWPCSKWRGSGVDRTGTVVRGAAWRVDRTSGRDCSKAEMRRIGRKLIDFWQTAVQPISNASLAKSC